MPVCQCCVLFRLLTLELFIEKRINLHFGTAWHSVTSLNYSCKYMACCGYYFRWCRDCVSVQRCCYDKTALISSHSHTEEISHALIFFDLSCFFPAFAIQKKTSSRLLTEWHSHITPILSSLHWLHLGFRINLKIYVIDHYITQRSNSYLRSLRERSGRYSIFRKQKFHSQDWGKPSLQCISAFSDQEIYISAFHVW